MREEREISGLKRRKGGIKKKKLSHSTTVPSYI